jgi:hypothetical protein
MKHMTSSNAAGGENAVEDGASTDVHESGDAAAGNVREQKNRTSAGE